MAKKKSDDVVAQTTDVAVESIAPLVTTFLTEGGGEVVAHPDDAKDIAQGIQQRAVKDEQGTDYVHVADDPSGRWIYRKGA